MTLGWRNPTIFHCILGMGQWTENGETIFWWRHLTTLRLKRSTLLEQGLQMWLRNFSRSMMRSLLTSKEPTCQVNNDTPAASFVERLEGIRECKHASADRLYVLRGPSRECP